MKTLNEADLGQVWGGVPSEETSFAYDVFYGLGAIGGSIWSFFTRPVPDRWHSGTLGGVHG